VNTVRVGAGSYSQDYLKRLKIFSVALAAPGGSSRATTAVRIALGGASGNVTLAQTKAVTGAMGGIAEQTYMRVSTGELGSASKVDPCWKICC